MPMSARCLMGMLFLMMAACGSSHVGDAGDGDGGDGDGGMSVPHPPFPLERREVDLSDEEFREFCEWWTSQWYSDPEDMTYECLDGAIVGRYLSVEGCIASRPDPATTPECTFTIGDWYGCILTSPDRCVPAPPECLRPDGCGVAAIWI